LSPRGDVTTIAIDGPAASGKSTIGKRLADKLNFLLLDTGCMYRAATLAALLKNIDIEDEEAVTELTVSLEMDIHPPPNQNVGSLYTVYLNGKDVTQELRSEVVDANVSQVSAYCGVRKNLVERQREISKNGNVVAVGRDIGTVVLPDAPLKLYLVASAEERARRRWEERNIIDESTSYQKILAEIVRRDNFDGQRKHSPMRPASDAIIIDTTGRTIDQIIDEILSIDYVKELLSKRY
jgi:cytidylate kinase